MRSCILGIYQEYNKHSINKSLVFCLFVLVLVFPKDSLTLGTRDSRLSTTYWLGDFGSCFLKTTFRLVFLPE